MRILKSRLLMQLSTLCNGLILSLISHLVFRLESVVNIKEIFKKITPLILQLLSARLNLVCCEEQHS